MTFLLPPQPVAVSPQRSIFFPGALGYPPYCSLHLHLEDLESFANEAFPVVAENIFHSLLWSGPLLEFLASISVLRKYNALPASFIVITSADLEGVRGRGRTREKVEVWHKIVHCNGQVIFKLAAMVKIISGCPTCVGRRDLDRDFLPMKLRMLASTLCWND